jgi:hypothetical protein
MYVSTHFGPADIAWWIFGIGAILIIRRITRGAK